MGHCSDVAMCIGALLVAFLTCSYAANLPVVMWHGMGDSCCDPAGLGALKEQMQKRLGVNVYSIATGNTRFEDVWSSFIGNVNDQVATVCKQLREIDDLQDGYHAIGFSQGAQFMRAVIQRCQHIGPKAHIFISVGGQHQGVANIPGCGSDGVTPASMACHWAEALLARGAYSPYVRTHVVQAQYFKDPDLLDLYLAANPFLPDVNNELEDKNQQYKDNIASLKKMVLIMFEDDTTVVPKVSSWFGYLDKDGGMANMTDLPLYKEDWIGIKTLDDRGDLVLDSWPGDHMRFGFDWFDQEVVEKYLKEGGDVKAV